VIRPSSHTKPLSCWRAMQTQHEASTKPFTMPPYALAGGVVPAAVL
jgi:hypothetical protein